MGGGGASLQQKYASRGVGAETVSEHTAGGTGPHDDEVVDIGHSFLGKDELGRRVGRLREVA